MIFFPPAPSSALPPPSILASLLLLSSLAFAETQEADNGSECNCFVTNSSSSAYFTNHRFYDYRSLSASSEPTLLTSGSATTNANATSDFFTSAQWTDNWTIQSWNNSASINTSDPNAPQVLMINSPQNIYISAKSSSDPLGTSDPAHQTHLTLRTARTSTFQSAAEFDSTRQNYQYMSARFLARVAGSPGACAGLFTYLGPSDSSPSPQRIVQEADIEILTAGPRTRVQYTNQPSVDGDGNVLAQATSNSTLPGKRDWAAWNVYRVDWEAKGTTWYVNGEKVAGITFQTPKDPASLILNMWGDGGSWTGPMAMFDQAYLQVQWMQVVFNTSGPFDGAASATGVDSKRSLVEKMGRALGKRAQGCKVVCSVDKETNSTSVGTPSVLKSGAASSLSLPLGVSSWALPLLLAMLNFV